MEIFGDVILIGLGIALIFFNIPALASRGRLT